MAEVGIPTRKIQRVDWDSDLQTILTPFSRSTQSARSNEFEDT